MEAHEMSTEVAKTIPIVVRIPPELGLTARETDMLQTKWQADLTKAAGNAESKIKWHITVHLEIGSE